MYTKMKDAFVHVLGEKGLSRAYVKLSRADVKSVNFFTMSP